MASKIASLAAATPTSDVVLIFGDGKRLPIKRMSGRLIASLKANHNMTGEGQLKVIRQHGGHSNIEKWIAEHVRIKKIQLA